MTKIIRRFITNHFLEPIFIFILYLVIRLIILTNKKKKTISENLYQDKNETFIIYCWHNRILTLCFFIPSFIRKKFIVLASRAGGGRMISRFLRFLNIDSIRGSSNKKNKKNKGGASAIRQALNLIKQKKIIGISPDGPRGPRYKLQPGLSYLLKESQVNALAYSVNYSSYWQLKTWDKLQIPKPFATVHIIVKEISINEKMNLREIEQNLKEGLASITND